MLFRSALPALDVAAVSEITDNNDLMETFRAQLTLMEQQLELLQVSE